MGIGNWAERSGGIGNRALGIGRSEAEGLGIGNWAERSGGIGNRALGIGHTRAEKNIKSFVFSIFL